MIDQKSLKVGDTFPFADALSNMLAPHDDPFPFGPGWKVDYGTDKYPPYNFYREDGDTYVLELAVAGIPKEDIEVEYDDNNRHLTISASNKKKVEGVDDVSSTKWEDKKSYEWADKKEYIYKGIASRSFKKVFLVGEKLTVKSSKLDNGMLSILFEKNEAKNARRLEIE